MSVYVCSKCRHQPNCVSSKQQIYLLCDHLGKPIKLYHVNNATLTPLKDQEVQKWRLACPETLSNENLKLVFLLLHANLVPEDFLQFNKIRYEGFKSTPTVISFDLGRETFLVSHITQEGKSDFDLRYVCPCECFNVTCDLEFCSQYSTSCYISGS